MGGDDLRRLNGWQMVSIRDRNPRSIGGDQLVTLDVGLDGMFVEKDSAVFAHHRKR
jgi:hypothetical protein